MILLAETLERYVVLKSMGDVLRPKCSSVVKPVNV